MILNNNDTLQKIYDLIDVNCFCDEVDIEEIEDAENYD